jgi:hypothetical protein
LLLQTQSPAGSSHLYIIIYRQCQPPQQLHQSTCLADLLLLLLVVSVTVWSTQRAWHWLQLVYSVLEAFAPLSYCGCLGSRLHIENQPLLVTYAAAVPHTASHRSTDLSTIKQ